ncbi:DNA-directed RNA polymerase I subunit RPA34 [Rhinophrynus dorsalis]
METPGGQFHFQCPLNFKPIAESEGAVSSDPDTEVWLIKAPADFNPESFSSHRIPLSGHKVQKVKVDGVRKLYHIMASPSADTTCRALLPQEGGSGDRIACTPPFQGVITLADAQGENTAIHSIPDRPPVAIPEGLKLRYCPFGAVAPKHSQNRGKSSSGSAKKKKAKKRKREEARDVTV